MVCKKIHALDWHLLGDLRRAATGETQMRTDDDAVHRPAAPCRDRERRETECTSGECEKRQSMIARLRTLKLIKGEKGRRSAQQGRPLRRRPLRRSAQQGRHSPYSTRGVHTGVGRRGGAHLWTSTSMPTLRSDEAEGRRDEAEGWSDEAEGWSDEAKGWSDEAEGWSDEAEGWSDEAKGWSDEAEGWSDEAEGCGTREVSPVGAKGAVEGGAVVGATVESDAVVGGAVVGAFEGGTSGSSGGGGEAAASVAAFAASATIAINSMIEVGDGSAPGAQSASSADCAATPALGFVTPALGFVTPALGFVTPARAQSGSADCAATAVGNTVAAHCSGGAPIGTLVTSDGP